MGTKQGTHAICDVLSRRSPVLGAATVHIWTGSPAGLRLPGGDGPALPPVPARIRRPRPLEPLLALLVVVLIALLAFVEVRNRRRISSLEELARTDALTGLPNRRGWREQLDRELARAVRCDDA